MVSTTCPESTPKKKPKNVTNYHSFCKAIAAENVQVAWMESKENLADALTTKVTEVK